MKNVFITGASSGIGAALAREYAAQGATLGLLARRRDNLEQLRRSLPNPELHHIYALDVTDHAALAAAATDFIQKTGKVHVVIANAGISVGTLTEYAGDLAVFERVVQTNLTATVATFAPFIQTMKRDAQQDACRPRRDCQRRRYPWCPVLKPTAHPKPLSSAIANRCGLN
jgi:NADP-dependent 3-hydroxy acid dehydrogenase YdfG